MTPRRKSYAAEYKLKAVKFAFQINAESGKENGSRAAAKHFGVDESMIRRWKNERHVLKATKRTKRAF